ncbi:hypothetical protein KC726_01540 [Candidatus Woesebacteria bacterium]|nr:hypothetical protein [Candidatus Woesebacteria bacterium]
MFETFLHLSRTYKHLELSDGKDFKLLLRCLMVPFLFFCSTCSGDDQNEGIIRRFIAKRQRRDSPKPLNEPRAWSILNDHSGAEKNGQFGKPSQGWRTIIDVDEGTWNGQ